MTKPICSRLDFVEHQQAPVINGFEIINGFLAKRPATIDDIPQEVLSGIFQFALGLDQLDKSTSFDLKTFKENMGNIRLICKYWKDTLNKNALIPLWNTDQTFTSLWDVIIKRSLKVSTYTKFKILSKQIKSPHTLFLPFEYEQYFSNEALKSIWKVISTNFHADPQPTTVQEIREFLDDPAQAVKLDGIVKLTLKNADIKVLPSEIAKFSALHLLIVNHNPLVKVLPEIGTLNRLMWLDLSHNNLMEIPSEIGKLSRLGGLKLNHNKLVNVPSEICELTELTELHLNNNLLTQIPANIHKLTKLSALYLHQNELNEIPFEVWKLGREITFTYGLNPLIRLTEEFKGVALS